MWIEHVPYYVWCLFIVVLALATVAGISPLMVDAGAYITEILHCVNDLARC